MPHLYDMDVVRAVVQQAPRLSHIIIMGGTEALEPDLPPGTWHMARPQHLTLRS
jgi:hypothetical protein